MLHILFAAACCHLKEVNIHVYERVHQKPSSFKRISCFNYSIPTQNTIHILYSQGVHYDHLTFSPGEINQANNIVENEDNIVENEEEIDQNDRTVNEEGGDKHCPSIPSKEDLKFYEAQILYLLNVYYPANRKNRTGRHPRDVTAKIICCNEALRGIYRGKLPSPEDYYMMNLPAVHEFDIVNDKHVRRLSKAQVAEVNEWTKKIHPDPRLKSPVEIAKQQSILDYMAQNPSQVGKRYLHSVFFFELFLVLKPYQIKFYLSNFQFVECGLMQLEEMVMRFHDCSN